ncbi:MAG: hypothetical protein WDZ51_08075 [Pirellulaceae bacterium]
MAGISTKRHGNRKSTGAKRTNRRRLAMTNPAMEMLEDRRMLAIDIIGLSGGVLEMEVSGTENINISTKGADLLVTGSGGYSKVFDSVTYFGGFSAADKLEGISLEGDISPSTQQLTIASDFTGLTSGITVEDLTNVTFQGALTGGDFDLQGTGFFSVTSSSGLGIGALTANFGGNITFSANITAESIDLVGRAFSSPGSVSVTTTGADGISIETTLSSLNARGTYHAQGTGGISLTTPSPTSSIQTDNLQTDGGTLSAAGGNLWVYGTLNTGNGAINFDDLEGSVTLSKGLTAGSLSAVSVASFSANGTSPVIINDGDLTIEATNANVRFQGDISTNGGNVSLESPSFRDVRVRSVDTDGGDFFVKTGSFYNNNGDVLDTGDGEIVLEVASNIGLNGPVTTGSFSALGTNSFRGQGSFSITASTGDISIDSLGRELLAGGLLETTSEGSGIYLNSDPTQRTIVSDLRTNGGKIESIGNNFQTSYGKSIETSGGHFDLSGHTGNIQIYGGVIVGSLDATNVASFTYSTTETLVATVGDVEIETTTGGIQITADIDAEGSVSLIAPNSQFVRIRGVETQGGNFVARGREFRNENGNMIVTNGGDINMNFAELVLIRDDVLTAGGDICLTADTLNASTAGVDFDTSGGYATFNVGTANIAGKLDTDGGTLNISLAPTAPNFYPEGSPVLFTVGEGNIVFNDGSILAIDPYKLSVAVGDKFDLVRAMDGEIENVDESLQVLSVGLDQDGNDITFGILDIGSNGINSGERLQVIADSTAAGAAKDITAFGPGNYRIVRDEAGTTVNEEDDFILLYRDCLLIMRRPVGFVSSVDVTGDAASSDTFTIDLSGGDPLVTGGVNFDGGDGAGFDEVFLINGTPTITTYTYFDDTSGQIKIEGVTPNFGSAGIFEYENVQQINDENSSGEIIFLLPLTSGHNAYLENSTLGSQITGVTFTNTLFANPSDSIFIDGRGGPNTIHIGQSEGPTAGQTYILPGVDLIIDSELDDVLLNADFLSGGSFIIDAATFTALEDTFFTLTSAANFTLSGELLAEGEGDRTFIAGNFDITAAAVNFNNANLLATDEDGILLVSTVGDITTGNIEGSFAGAAITLTAAVDANVSSVTTNDGAFNVTGVNLYVDDAGIINTGTGDWNIAVSGTFEIDLLSTPQFQDLHFEGFEDPAWAANLPGNWQNSAGGDIEKVPSGNAGIPSYEGSSHAIITNLSEVDDVFGDPSLGGSSPYTQFGGYSDQFGGGFATSLHVYLDPGNWDNGDGFDFSSAVSNQDGGHLRDFIAHIGKVGGALLFNGSNNSDRNFNGFKLLNENNATPFTINSAGWYAIEHVFYDDGGFLSVDINLRDASGNLLFTVTRETMDDIATTVGGNRYGWLVFNNIDGLAVDNTRLFVASRQHIGGEINVSAGSVELPDSSILASGDVDIESTSGSITMQDLETTGPTATVQITSADAISMGDVTAVDGAVTITALNQTELENIATAAGNVTITSTASSVDTYDVTTAGGNVLITAATDITTMDIDTSGDVGGTITLIAEGDISTDDLTSQDANITLDAGGEILSGNGVTGGGDYDAFADGDVTVGDVTSLGGDIDLTSVNGDVTHGDLDSSGSGGDITILATAGSVTGGNITTGGGDLLIDALNNILVGMIDANGLAAPSLGTVLIESEEGSVTTGSIISFGEITISAAGDITVPELETTGSAAAISLFGDADAYLGSITTLGGDLTIAGYTGSDLANLYFSSDAVVNTGTGNWDISVAGEVVFEESTINPVVIHFEGFEDPSWETDSSSDNWQEFGTTLTRAESGDGGIDSATGVAHAVMGTDGGIFTRFGGYSTEFQNGFSTSLAVYLDPADFSNGDGFDYTVAASRQTGAHLRDFIFHVGMVDGDLLVNASNNTDGQFNAFKLNNENGGDNFEITTAGWYTLEHVFRDDNGVLAVDLNLKNESGTELYSITRSNATDYIATVVGGNRYGWIIFNDVADLAIDDTQLTRSGVSERTHVGGNITIEASTISLVDSNLEASGEVNLNADSVVGLAIDAEGDVTVATTDDISLADVSGELISLTAGGKVTTFDITSTGTDSAVIISASANTGTSVNVRNISAAGDVDIDGVSSVITGSIDGELVSVTSTEGSAVTGGITSFGDVEVLAGVDITTGAIETTSGAELEGLVLLESSGGSIDVQGNILTDSSDVTAQATGDVDVLDVTTNGGNITLIADSDENNAGTLTYGNLNAGGGDIYVKGADVVTTGSTVINTDGGSFTFVSANGNFIFNKIDTTGTSSDGNVSINAGGFVQGLQSPSITAGSGSLGITAVGDVTTKALSAGSIDIESTGGLIGVTGTVFAANLVSLDASGDVDVTGMITSTGGNVVVEAGGDVTFGGTVSFPNGSLLVGTPGNEVGNFSSLALSGGQSIKVASSGTVTAGTITTLSDGGEVEILAVGDVQTGGITVLEGLNPGTVTINTAGSITTASIWSEGDLTLISSGSGAISSGGQDLTARQGDIVIDTEGAVTTRHLFAQNGAITVGTATEEVASLTAGRLVAGEEISIYADGKVWLSKGSTDGVIAGTGVMIEGASLLVSFADPGVLQSITTSAGDISITVDTTAVTNSLNAAGGSVTIIATGEISSGAIDAGGSIDIEGDTGDITTGGLDSGGAISVETNGVVWISRGSDHISATSGVTISGNALWAVFAKPGASRNITTSEGDISIDVATTVETGSLTAEKGSVTIEASGDITSGDIVANGNAIDPNPGNITIDATTGDITSGRLVSGGTLNVTTSGDIWISKNSSGSSAKSNVTISGNSLLASFNGSLHRPIASEEGSVSIIVSDNVITHSLSAGTTVDVDASGAIQTGTVTGPDGIVLDATSGDITTGALSATGTDADITIVTSGAVSVGTSSMTADRAIAIGTSGARVASLTSGNLTAGTTVDVYTTTGDITTGTVTGPDGVTLDSATGDITSSGDLTATAGTVSVIAPQGSVVTGTIDGDIYVLNAESYTINGDLTNSVGIGSSVALYVDAALINSNAFAELLTVNGTWTLADDTVVNVAVDGDITDPVGDLPQVIASASSVDDQGATINVTDTNPVDDFFAAFDGTDLELDLLL